ncbi:hypothetical protein GE061_011078 [Apolygus lucorum]|uniref:DNA-directed RNA polymerase III subunit RPC9 n=1 Tax=Apolygus lucorum TaxID=248454 RepID=A0A8S9XXU6_APOLU|nr:hypothetical protein GE061_011078 [Apolygus lucorum]
MLNRASVFTGASGATTTPQKSKSVKTRAISKSLFLVSAFLEGFVKFSYDAHGFFFLQTALELPPDGALRFYHLQRSLFFVCVSLSPLIIMSIKPKSAYWVMILFDLLTLVSFCVLAVISFLFQYVNFKTNVPLVLSVTMFTSVALGGKWYWMRRTIYEQHRFPKELDEYIRGLTINVFVTNLGRISGMLVVTFVCGSRTGPIINFFYFYSISAAGSLLELFVMLFGLVIARKGTTSNLTAAIMVRNEIKVFYHTRSLPEKSLFGTIKFILPLYLPLLCLLANRDQRFSLYVRQAEMLDLQLTDDYRVHPTFLNVTQPLVIVLLVYPFQFLLDILRKYEISFHTRTRSLCVFVFMTLSLFGGSLLQVFIEDRAEGSILVEHGCIVLYNTFECPASIDTEFQKTLYVNPVSHIMLMSTPKFNILKENNHPMEVKVFCGAEQFLVTKKLVVKKMEINEYLLTPIIDSEVDQLIVGADLKRLEPRKINSIFFFANTVRLVHSTRFNMTIIGKKIARYYSDTDEYADSLEIFPDGRYAIIINGLLLHELKITKGTSLSILISKSIYRNQRLIPLSRIIEILPQNVIKFYYQIPQIFILGLADLLIDTPGFIYGGNVVSSDWHEALQLMWFFTQALANLGVASGIVEFVTPLYDYLVAFCISMLSTRERTALFRADMEVKETEVAALCNLEVLNLLNEIKDTSVNNSSTGNQLATILYEASQHLQNSCGSQTSSDVRNLLGALLNFPVKFTHNEKLMIVNTPPKTALELSLIVHNYDERMTDEQVEELIEIINNTCS